MGRTARVTAALAVALLLALGAADLVGVRWLAIATPSMGTAAPVGALVVTVPGRTADLGVGDLVAVRADGVPGGTLVHRVVARRTGDRVDGGPSGGVTVLTRGDLNGAPDPGVVTDARLVGRAVAVLPALGYVVRGLPRGVAGVLLVLVLTRWWAPRPVRTSLRVLGISVVHAALVLGLHPFLGVVTTASATTPDGAAHVSVVSTGLLPTRVVVLAPGSPATRRAVSPVLAQGERAELVVRDAGAGGGLVLRPHVALPWWGWMLLWSVCLAPLAVARPRQRRRTARP